MVYHTLVTLLHRPFVESGHHNLADGPTVELCWARCEEAARGATTLLSVYRRTFTLARAPYLIVSRQPSSSPRRPAKHQSYANFVAATIHVRIAAQRGSGSEAARLLLICLEAFKENAGTNPGVRKMYDTIVRLMDQLGVSLPSPSAMDLLGPSEEFTLPDVDLQAIISSFGGNMPLQAAEYGGVGFGELGEAHPQPQLQDILYGFLGIEPNA